jgi:hypothetical protein
MPNETPIRESLYITTLKLFDRAADKLVHASERFSQVFL